MSGRKKLVVGNWKMHLDIAQSLSLVQQLDNRISPSPKVEVVLCPAFMALEPVRKKVKEPKFKLGAQNVHFMDEGAFTGEVSARMLKGLSDYVIIGHSERRLHFGETNATTARKVSAAVRNGLVPILCVGENLFERQDDETARVIHDQLTAGLVMLTASEVGEIVVAYEPVWAIGTGEIAKPEQVKKAISIIRKTISDLFGSQAGQTARVLYGGSVVPDFVKDYLEIKELDGFLVGGASLNYELFSHIVKIVQGVAAKPKAKSAKK